MARAEVQCVHTSGPHEPARIAQCELVLDEVHESEVEMLRKLLFEEMETQWDDPGSPFQQWYRSIATGPNAVKSPRSEHARGIKGRLISWKTGKPFDHSNLFFRTLDSGRLLPMHLADFRVQFYAHASQWEIFDKPREDYTGRNTFKQMSILGMMHELALLRNMHDNGGGDVPVIILRWDVYLIDHAMRYWVELSKGEWTDEERIEKFNECDRLFCRYLRPCFLQADLLVRSLLSDPEVGYVPPFIVFLPALPDTRSRVLFTDPSHCPPQAFLDTFPKCCGGRGCDKKECGSFDLGASQSLARGSALVRKDFLANRRVVCNLWGCEVPHASERGEPLLRCQKCKETLYCSVEHQTRDWRVHKNVCEKAAK